MSRFRVSVFKERGNYGIVLRQIPNRLMTLEQIGLPPSVKDLLFRPRRARPGDRGRPARARPRRWRR